MIQYQKKTIKKFDDHETFTLKFNDKHIFEKLESLTSL